jgi:hypothetical protein
LARNSLSSGAKPATISERSSFQTFSPDISIPSCPTAGSKAFSWTQWIHSWGLLSPFSLTRLRAEMITSRYWTAIDCSSRGCQSSVYLQDADQLCGHVPLHGDVSLVLRRICSNQLFVNHWWFEKESRIFIG